MKAVLFDLFETIVTDSDPDWIPPAQSIAQRLGIEERIFEPLWHRFDTAWQLGEIGSYEESMAEVCKPAGQGLNGALLSVISTLASEHGLRKAKAFASIEADIIGMVTAIATHGIKLGVITNASNLDLAPWPGCALAPLFDDFVASHAVELLKPDAHIYELACRRLHLNPSDTIFVGDGGSGELGGAVQAGLTVYWYSWFLDRWPEGVRPIRFAGDAWRQYPSTSVAPYHRLAHPSELVGLIE